MDSKQVISVVLISAATSLVVVGVVLYFGMRGPLPLIDTAQTKAEFEEKAAA